MQRLTSITTKRMCLYLWYKPQHVSSAVSLDYSMRTYMVARMVAYMRGLTRPAKTTQAPQGDPDQSLNNTGMTRAAYTEHSVAPQMFGAPAWGSKSILIM